MPPSPRRMQITCPGCSMSRPCGVEELLRRLQAIGMLRREKDPDWDLVIELCNSTSNRFICPECGHLGLTIGEARDDWDDDDWEPSRNCEGCGKPIPSERLEAFPDTRRCIRCQQSAERGEDDSQPDYCPRCGTPRIMRRRPGGGLAGYEMYCPECRK